MEMRTALERIRKIIRNEAKGSGEIISYGIPIIRYNDQLLVGFGATRDHCSFYLMSSRMIPRLARARNAELKGYDVKGATIHFTAEKPLPAALVKKLVKERMLENKKKAGR
jgi:uncharacterized protein YdhG (YjbR/CyaY superfamily)